jgi:type IX secretion system PorP/SprF family membrane protein
MKGIFLVLIIAISSIVRAQDIPVFHQYFLDYEILNPAFTGMQNCYAAGISDHHQWLGIKEAPNTQVAFTRGRFTLPGADNYHGLGLLLVRDQNGAFRKLNAALQYSYHLLLSEAGKTHMSLGLSASINQVVLDEGEFYNYSYDPVINGTRLSAWNPDLTLGIGIYHRQYFGGITAARLLPALSFVSDPRPADYNQRLYIFFAGLRIKSGKNDLELEPSVAFILDEAFYSRLDLNSKIIIKSKYWLGVSVRKFMLHEFKGGFTALPSGGIKINKLEIAYSYGLGFSVIQRHSYGSHSLMLSWKLCRESKGALPCPAYD